MTTGDNRHTDLSCCNGNLRVVVVDPSCFSLPYDYSLCDGLARLGVNIMLARSEFIHSQWRWPSLNFEDWKHFYPLCHAYAQRHVWKNRKRKAARVCVLCIWKLSRAISVSSLIERMKVQWNEMDAGSDTAILELLNEFIPADFEKVGTYAQDEQVP